MTNDINWIGVDWGTTQLRAYALNANDHVLNEAYSDKGMGKLNPLEFEAALMELIADWLPVKGTIPVLACGMVGARQGWAEAPYQVTPCLPNSPGELTKVMTDDPRISVSILPGICQMTPPDVMRGEETQIAGLIKPSHELNATVCLPGTHSKWASISNGMIKHFSTFMTGEMFMLLSERSILRHSVDSKEWVHEAFIEGVLTSKDEPHNWLNSSFRLRADELLNNTAPASARSRLSGILIGAEIAATENNYRGKTIDLIGDPALTKIYEVALEVFNRETQVHDPKALTLAGLRNAHRSIYNTLENI